MNWERLLSSVRFGMEAYRSEKRHDRTEYQRDYDRLIFSSPFRRLQNKTQVFPLPGSVFVHNRLTHSLEVSSVGRSLGRIPLGRSAKDIPIHRLISKRWEPLSLLPAWLTIWAIPHSDTRERRRSPPFSQRGEDRCCGSRWSGKGADGAILPVSRGMPMLSGC